jgi:hypothetical protein
MAGGRDLRRRSPRWLNGLIWSSGLGAAALFIWRTLFCDSEPSCVPPGLAGLLPKVLGSAVLPFLVLASLLERAARRVAEW